MSASPHSSSSLSEWVGDQFHEMGLSDSSDLAVTFLPMVEGAALLANDTRDSELLARQGLRLEKWVAHSNRDLALSAAGRRDHHPRNEEGCF